MQDCSLVEELRPPVSQGGSPHPHCSRYPCAKRSLRGYLLRDQCHLGTRHRIVQKFLVSPTPRTALVLGKGFSAGIRTLSQAIVVYGLSLLLGVKLNSRPLALINVFVIVILAATLFSTFSLIIACIVKTRERFMGVGQVLTMPLFFASNAIYPTAIMPAWLKVISNLNPLTYVVDALRTFMLSGSTSSFGLGLNYAVILLTTIVLVFIGARLYPQLGV